MLNTKKIKIKINLIKDIFFKNIIKFLMRIFSADKNQT